MKAYEGVIDLSNKRADTQTINPQELVSLHNRGVRYVCKPSTIILTHKGRRVMECVRPNHNCQQCRRFKFIDALPFDF